MNRYTQKTILIIHWALALLILGCLLIPINSASATTIISNSVSVSANSSNGESHAAVTTIINGEVIEDWSATSTEPIVYAQTHISTSSVTNSVVSTETSTRDQLKAMIAQLEAIISFYVSLLNH